MLQRKSLAVAALAAASFAPATFADGRNPGSVLIYTMHRSGNGLFTIASVTNTNTVPAVFNEAGGTTNVLFEYVNTLPNAADPFLPIDCYVVDRLETLTPADTLSVLTTCHNAAEAEGYLVVTATSLFAADGKQAWSHNYLTGSELIVSAVGGVYSLSAIPFEAVGENDDGVTMNLGNGGGSTDLDGDGQLDFDGHEYEGVPEELYIDNFLAVADSSLTLLNLTGGTRFDALVAFDIWNDNEQPLSATRLFRCWFEEPLSSVSPVFSQDYLANNTPHDPEEVDLNCDGAGDAETGWARIRGLAASSAAQTIQDVALLGSITAGPIQTINGGRLLWESPEKVYTGSFLNFGVTADVTD